MMRFRLMRWLAAVTLFAVPVPGWAQQQTGGPKDIGLTEKVDVRLMVIDVVVLDRQNRTVPDLTLQDFEIERDGRPVRPDTLDLACPE